MKRSVCCSAERENYFINLLFTQDEISDFSDDDEPMKSAAELLSQQFGVENGYGQEEEYF